MDVLTGNRRLVQWLSITVGLIPGLIIRVGYDRKPGFWFLLDGVFSSIGR